MDKLAVILAVIAVGLGGYATFGKTEGSGASYDTSVSDLAERIATLEAQNESYREMLGVEGAMAADGPSPESGTATAGALKGRAPVGMPKRVAELEAKFDSYDKRFADMEAKAASAPKRRSFDHAPAFMGKKFLANLDQAEKALSLDANQRAQMDRIIDSTKTELDRLYEIPNDDGKTLKELMKPTKINLGGDAESTVVSLMGNFGKIRKFKKSKVPGSNETYAEAEKRIRDAGKRDARGLLNQDQQKTWDGSHTDPLFGRGATAGAMIAFDSAVVAPGK